MGDILSQSEIDNLLESLETDAPETTEQGQPETADQEHVEVEHEIKEYNFSRPPKFNKEHLKTLEVIFDNFSRAVSSFLTGYLRTPVSVEVVNAEQLTYREFNNALPNPVIISIVDLIPLKGSIVIELTASLGFAIIDRVLGGPGFGVKKLREFSEIEKILIKRVISQVINFLVEPWENVIALKPRLDKIETNPQFAQIISPNEMVARVSLKLKIGEVDGYLNFCLPHMVLEPVMDRLNMRHWYTLNADVDEPAEFEDLLTEKIEETPLDIKAIIGKTYITVSDFTELQVGDVIPLDSFIDCDLEVMVSNMLKFHAKPGVSRNKNAVQITSVVRKENI